jgi:hypothetical protein
VAILTEDSRGPILSGRVLEVKMLKETVRQIVPRTWLHRYRHYVDRRRFQRALRPTDVFLVGHPKSGNTWLAYMLAVLLEKNQGRRATLANVQDFVPVVHNRDSKIMLYSDLPSPRIFRNEGPRYAGHYPKTIYIVRDPRAVLISWYHHFLHDYPDEIVGFDDFLHTVFTYGNINRAEPHIVRWDRQVLEWFARAKSQCVWIARYEDLIKDRREVLRRAIEFTGLASDEASFNEAVERSSFENMRQEELLYGAEPYSGTKGERGYYTRRGKSNAWKEEIEPGVLNKIEAQFARAMKVAGYLAQ